MIYIQVFFNPISLFLTTNWGVFWKFKRFINDIDSHYEPHRPVTNDLQGCRELEPRREHSGRDVLMSRKTWMSWVTVGSYEHCDPHGRGEIEQRTTAGTKHMEVQVSREGRKPVGTGGGTSPGDGRGRVSSGTMTESSVRNKNREQRRSTTPGTKHRRPTGM